MMVVMPGYNMMWFGESSSGSNLDWTGFTSWTNLGQDMIVVSAQLTDWGDTSARQAIALTEYFINHFAVDTARIYAAGWTDEQIDTVLQMQTPDNAFFDAQGLHVYHAAANVVFDDADILNWIVSKHK